jgi:RHS repeat-associated protein
VLFYEHKKAVPRNARYYDSDTGRFISPDPTIPNPTSTQHYNRYMFVTGNPISLMDASGYSGTTGGAQGTVNESTERDDDAWRDEIAESEHQADREEYYQAYNDAVKEEVTDAYNDTGQTNPYGGTTYYPDREDARNNGMYPHIGYDRWLAGGNFSEPMSSANTPIEISSSSSTQGSSSVTNIASKVVNALGHITNAVGTISGAKLKKYGSVPSPLNSITGRSLSSFERVSRSVYRSTIIGSIGLGVLSIGVDQFTIPKETSVWERLQRAGIIAIAETTNAFGAAIGVATVMGLAAFMAGGGAVTAPIIIVASIIGGVGGYSVASYYTSRFKEEWLGK